MLRASFLLPSRAGIYLSKNNSIISSCSRIMYSCYSNIYRVILLILMNFRCLLVEVSAKISNAPTTRRKFRFFILFITTLHVACYFQLSQLNHFLRALTFSAWHVPFVGASSSVVLAISCFVDTVTVIWQLSLTVSTSCSCGTASWKAEKRNIVRRRN